MSNPWDLYDQLIAGVPEGPCVTEYCLGTHWSYVQAECGMGVAFTTSGGTPRKNFEDFRGRPVKEVAQLAKSWCFEEASLGIAALNAWYAHRDRLSALTTHYEQPEDDPAAGGRLGMKLDAFDLYRPRIEAQGNANVVVVGHFPHVTNIADYANLTVLERKCSDEWDTPDPACEYVMPQADYAFITGVTIINKTCPRLLQLAENAHVVMVGPSVVMSPIMFDYGVETLAGSVVSDPEAAKFGVMNGKGKFFGKALEMMYVTK
ncbi:MAG: DUF364 domain-containing protein [Coriobacteriia bacterium]|nr:DUF364 domain-containing protein [Coriobacteriia bacterium]